VVDAQGRPIGAGVRTLTWAGRSGTIVMKTSPGPTPAVEGAPPAGVPHKLLLEIPTDVAAHAVRLEFTDIPLP
jgi:hypothetical protein